MEEEEEPLNARSAPKYYSQLQKLIIEVVCLNRSSTPRRCVCFGSECLHVLLGEKEKNPEVLEEAKDRICPFFVPEVTER